jgi:F0F1-type ATP synthase membrane subunit b/b'
MGPLKGRKVIMAGLEIIPDPKIVAMQMGIFAGNLLICKKLFVEPFLNLISKRDSLSTDLDKQAARFRLEAVGSAQKIQDACRSIDAEVAQRALELDAQAKASKMAQLAQVKEATASSFSSFQQELLKASKEERAKLDTTAEALAQDFYRLVWERG